MSYSNIFDEKIICKKYDINLLLCKSKNSNELNKYRLNLEVHNNSINIDTFINNNLFELLCKLNKDIIDEYKIINNGNNINVFILFKRFGQELGIKQKYSYFESSISKNNKSFVIKTKVLKCPTSLIKNDCESLDYTSSFINIKLLTTHSCRIDYIFDTFKTDIDLPIYMENLFGLLTKKLFYRLKIFIEKL
jgi:hypothetical protein